jgi:hypothetical protein
VLSGTPLPVHAWEKPADAAATLVSARAPLAPARGAAGPGTRTPAGPGVPAWIPGWGPKALLAGALIAAAVGVGYLARGWFAPAGAPAPSAPSPGTEAAPGPGGPSVADRVGTLLQGSERAQVSLDFGHSLKSGTLRVFVDDASVIEADLDSRVTRRIAGVSLRKGSLRDSFHVEPGRHEIRLRVAWDGNVKTESIWANFQPGSKRRLEARLRVGGLQDLSLNWR